VERMHSHTQLLKKTIIWNRIITTNKVSLSQWNEHTKSQKMKSNMLPCQDGAHLIHESNLAPQLVINPPKQRGNGAQEVKDVHARRPQKPKKLREAFSCRSM
jgi:hypothetical protein